MASRGDGKLPRDGGSGWRREKGDIEETEVKDDCAWVSLILICQDQCSRLFVTETSVDMNVCQGAILEAWRPA